MVLLFQHTLALAMGLTGRMISFRLSFERYCDIYSGVAKEIFPSANRHAVTKRQIVQEVKNFLRQIRFLDGSEFYINGGSAVKPVKDFLLIVEKMLQKTFVRIAAQEDDIFPFIVFNEPAQRFNILVAHAVQVVSEENCKRVIVDRKFLPKRSQFIEGSVHIADSQNPFVWRIVYGRDNFLRVVDEKFFVVQNSHTLSKLINSV